MKRIGAVIVFEDDVSLEEVQEWVDGYSNAGVIQTADIQQFDDALGSPVFYIP